MNDKYIECDEYSKILKILIHRRKVTMLTQDQVGKKAGYARRTITNWENKNRYPSIFALIDWANSLGYKLTITKIQD